MDSRRAALLGPRRCDGVGRGGRRAVRPPGRWADREADVDAESPRHVGGVQRWVAMDTLSPGDVAAVEADGCQRAPAQF